MRMDTMNLESSQPARPETEAEVIPDTGRSETAGDVLVLRVYGPGQDRRVV